MKPCKNHLDCDPNYTTCVLGHRNAHECHNHELHEIYTQISNGDPIKALCWKQPFASLMLPPWNKVETRTQRVHYRGLVLIVATKAPYPDSELIKLCGGEQALMLEMKVAGHDGYMNGHAIAIGMLDGCGDILPHHKTFIKPEHHVGRYAWTFSNVHAIEPIPMAGFQGWRNVDDELRSKIRLL